MFENAGTEEQKAGAGVGPIEPEGMRKPVTIGERVELPVGCYFLIGL
jgi:hypothetical protein